MEVRVFVLLLTCVIASREQYDCERQPEVIKTFQELSTCKDKTFKSNFNKGVMNVTCAKPRDTVVPIASDEPGIQYTPNAVLVKRCGGACPQSSCVPADKRMVPFSVLGRKGEKHTCGTVYVEEHLRCKCDCRVMQSHCIPVKQTYDRPACMCKCMNMKEKEECERNDRLWEQKSCKCRCKKEEDCTTGLHWVPTLCNFNCDDCRLLRCDAVQSGSSVHPSYQTTPYTASRPRRWQPSFSRCMRMMDNNDID